MTYPAGLMPNEKSFLSRLFSHEAGLETSYSQCQDMLPSARPQLLREKMISTRRQLWGEHDIEEGHRETLTNHVVAMKDILYSFPVPSSVNFDAVEKCALSGAW